MTEEDAPLYDLRDPSLLAQWRQRIMHYGTTTAVCGAQVPAGQRTDISALVSCQHCLSLVPPPARGHWAVVYGPKREEP